MTSLQRASVLAIAAAACLFAANASAELCTDFENYIGAPEGFPLTGQFGWYIPAGTASVDFNVHTYFTGNPGGIPDNPTGGLFFVAGVGPGNSVFARAQHDETFTNEEWCFEFDFCANFIGATASNNVGSFSSQPASATSGLNDFIFLHSWVTGQEGVLYQLGYMVCDATGVQAAQPGLFPGTEWQNLPLQHWFRSSTKINFATNRVTEVSLTDIDTGATVTVDVSGLEWYLEGGAAGSTEPATGFRLFAGATSNPGNVLAFDNLCVRPCGATAVEPSTWGSIKARFDAPEGGNQKAAPVPMAYPVVQ